MQTNIIKYGLIAGGVIVLIPVITGWLIGYGPETFKIGEIVGYSTIVLSLLLIFLAVNEYQKSNPDMVVSFGKIFFIGLGISGIAGIMFGIYNLVYVYYIAPDFMEQYFGYYIENIRNSGAPAEQVSAEIAKLEQEKEIFMNPVVNFLVMFATVFMIGIVVSLVSGLVQRSKNQGVNAHG